MKKVSLALTVLCLSALLALPASAAEYSFSAADCGTFGAPTSVETVTYFPQSAPETGSAIQFPPDLRPLQTARPVWNLADFYAGDGSIGRLEIPRLGLSVKVVEGVDSAALSQGAGHFPSTGLWDGNVCIASHNRGPGSYFGQIHTLRPGDLITLTTVLGTRTYAVTGVEKVAAWDSSGTAETGMDQITLYTCVQNQSAWRWCVKGVRIV